MNIFISLTNIIKRVKELDQKSKKLFEQEKYANNPFSFIQNKTYVWLEYPNEHTQCKYRNNPNN